MKSSLVSFLIALVEGNPKIIINTFTISFNTDFIWEIITVSILQLFYYQRYNTELYSAINSD